MGIYGNPKENLHSKPLPPCLNLWEFMGILKKTYTPSRYPRPENPKKNLQFNVVCWLVVVVVVDNTRRGPLRGQLNSNKGMPKMNFSDKWNVWVSEIWRTTFSERIWTRQWLLYQWWHGHERSVLGVKAYIPNIHSIWKHCRAKKSNMNLPFNCIRLHPTSTTVLLFVMWHWDDRSACNTWSVAARMQQQASVHSAVSPRAAEP